MPDPSMDQSVPQSTYVYYNSHMSSKAASLPTTGPIKEPQDNNGHLLRWMPGCAVQSIYPSVEGGLLRDVCTKQVGPCGSDMVYLKYSAKGKGIFSEHTEERQPEDSIEPRISAPGCPFPVYTTQDQFALEVTLIEKQMALGAAEIVNIILPYLQGK